MKHLADKQKSEIALYKRIKYDIIGTMEAGGVGVLLFDYLRQYVARVHREVCHRVSQQRASLVWRDITDDNERQVMFGYTCDESLWQRSGTPRYDAQSKEIEELVEAILLSISRYSPEQMALYDGIGLSVVCLDDGRRQYTWGFTKKC